MQTVHPTEAQTDEHNAFEAKISAWVDGQDDVRPEDVATPYGRQLWDTYHLIGDVLRNDSLAIQPRPAFCTRLSRALDAEPAIVAPTRWWSRHPALCGLAVTAAVAAVAWVALPYVMPRAEMDAQTVLAIVSDDGPLGDYLQAHRESTGAAAMQRASFGVARP